MSSIGNYSNQILHTIDDRGVMVQCNSVCDAINFHTYALSNLADVSVVGHLSQQQYLIFVDGVLF